MRPLLTLLTLTLTLAAGCRDKSDDELIRDAVHRALTAVNEKKPGAVVEDAAADFKGPRSANLQEVRRIITGYLLTQGWVRAFERKLEVAVDGGSAHVDLEVVVTKGNKVERLEDVIPTQASVLDMDLDLEKREAEWRFTVGDYKVVPF